MSEAAPSIMAQSWPWGSQIAVEKKKVMHTWSLFSAKSLIVSGILLRYASVSIHVRNIWVSIIEQHLNVETEPN